MKYFLLVIVSLFFLAPVFIQAAGTCNPDQVTKGCSVVGEECKCPPTSTTAPAFVSLTDIPAFDGLTDSLNISDLLNNIYGLCIGLASVLAVGMIMYGGLMYMGGDSITEKKAARQKITAAVLGLLLVLSPAIVFGIIDKRILKLEIDTSPLTPTATTGSLGSDGYPTSGTWESTDLGSGTEACKKQGGIVTPTGNGMRCTPQSASCEPLYGTTQIPTEKEGCCLAQSGCSLSKKKSGTTAAVSTCTCPALNPIVE